MDLRGKEESVSQSLELRESETPELAKGMFRQSAWKLKRYRDIKSEVAEIAHQFRRALNFKMPEPKGVEWK
ncbi:hypothetical protein SUGI_0618370 [Cryptomeria japonica]|nr:hypothetical protein SUGI_0618370 [Cryptomeria japonica]